MSPCTHRNCGKEEVDPDTAAGVWKIMAFARWCAKQPGPVAVGETCNPDGIMGLAKRYCAALHLRDGTRTTK